MAQIGETRKSIEAPFMNDYWRFRKEKSTPEDRTDYWDDVVKSLTDLSEKYGMDPYIDTILLACVDDIEFRSKAKVNGDLTLQFLNEIRKMRGLPKVGVLK